MLLTLVVAIIWWLQNNPKKNETLANGYSFERTQWELSHEYQHDRVMMVFKYLSILVRWTKAASALEGLSNYRILPINRTVRVEVGKIFCRRGFGNLPFYRTPQWLAIVVYWPLLHLRALAVQLAWRYNPPLNKFVDWSIVWSCGEYEQWESERTA